VRESIDYAALCTQFNRENVDEVAELITDTNADRAGTPAWGLLAGALGLGPEKSGHVRHADSCTRKTRMVEMGMHNMKFSALEVNCPFTLGDVICDGDKAHTITNVVCLQYRKNPHEEIMYELDNSGELVYIIPTIKRGYKLCGQ